MPDFTFEELSDDGLMEKVSTVEASPKGTDMVSGVSVLFGSGKVAGLFRLMRDIRKFLGMILAASIIGKTTV
jgi:hypothetical protein